MHTHRCFAVVWVLLAVGCGDSSSREGDVRDAIDTDATGDGADANSSTGDAPDDHDAPADTAVATDTGGTEVPTRETSFELDPTAPGTFLDRVAFLYSGPDARQQAVDTTAFEPARLAVVRGLVTDPAGEPRAGVRVVIKDHPEHGYTLTGDDGMFDLAVNGGGRLTVRYTHPDYLPVDRVVATPWGDWVLAPDVTLTALDQRVTEVTMGASQMQVARGSPVTDEDGARQVTLLFAADTRATLVLADGTEEPASALHVRATEYTVGPRGPSAMPADLPPTSGYTFAAELSADEARAIGATEVVFDRDVIVYLEDFIGLPVGWNVPVGFYEAERGAWVAAPNGRIVAVIGVDAGRATIDADGDGQADGAAALAALGISDDERAQVAALYAPGQALWRVPIRHFSIPDFNYALGLPTDARPPTVPPPNVPEDTECHTESGSIIGCESQTLGERIPIAGTPWALRYSSDRAGTTLARVNIPVTDDQTPASVSRAEVRVAVAGRSFRQGFSRAPGQTHTFTWDGRDAYGRALGVARASVEVRYYYAPVYTGVTAFEGFGQYGDLLGISDTPARDEYFLAARNEVVIGNRPAPEGLGGWALDAHHVYDPQTRVMTRGDGSLRRDSAAWARTLQSFTGIRPATSDGSSLYKMIAVAPDGSLYAPIHRSVLSNTEPQELAHIRRSGAADRIVVPPVDPAIVSQLQVLVVAPDGALILGESDHDEGGTGSTTGGRVRRMAPDGTVSTLGGGNGAAMFFDGDIGDGGPALAARLDGPSSLALGPDGSIYVGNPMRVRRIDPAGNITTVLGTGNLPAAGPLDPNAVSQGPQIAVAPDGSLYVANRSYLSRVAPDGEREIVYGVQGVFTSTALGVAVAPNGFVYLAGDTGIARLFEDGSLSLVVGGPSSLPGPTRYQQQHSGAPIPALAVHLVIGGGRFGLLPDGGMVIANTGEQFGGLLAFDGTFQAGADVAVGVPDEGDRVHLFDRYGRHLETTHALTAGRLAAFSYDARGRLSEVIDAAGLVTRITRSEDDRVVTITGPYGHATTLDVDPRGWLERVVDPRGATWQMTYDPSAPGLLTAFEDPEGATSTMTYDADQRLVSDTNAALARQTLSREERDGGQVVTHTSATGAVTRYETTRSIGGSTRTTTEGLGLVTTSVVVDDASDTTTTPDGVVVTSRFGSDPRFGMSRPVLESRTTRMPSGLTRTEAVARQVSLSDPDDLETLMSQTDSITVNGRVLTSTYAAFTRTRTTRSPAGRTLTETLDAAGRVTRVELPGVTPVVVQYDASGRVAQVTQGERAFGFVYAASGDLQTITDPLARAFAFTHDAAGGLESATLADGTTIGFGSNLRGELTSLTTPAGGVFTITRDALGDVTRFSAPTLAGIDDVAVSYDADRRVTGVTRPSGARVTFTYDAAGRIATRTDADGTATVTYVADGPRVARIALPDQTTLDLTYDGALLTRQQWGGLVAPSGAPSVSAIYDGDLRVTATEVRGATGSSVTTTTGYDLDGFVVQAGALALTRDPGHAAVTATSVGRATTAITYSDYAELASIAASIDGAEVFRESLTRDALGRITAATEIVEGVTTERTYTRDLRGRITVVTTNGAEAERYTYDAQGNRLSAVTAGGSASGSYDAQDRQLAHGPATFTHDADGKRVTKTDATGTTTYTYDAQENLVGVALPGGRTIRYTVDAMHRRVARRVDGAHSQTFVYLDALRPAAELDATGAIVSTFVYGDGGGCPDLIMRGAATYRVFKDHSGSPRLVVDTATGAVMQRLDYDTFGAVTRDTSPGFQPFGYAGGLWDRDTGLVHFGARDYDPITGRWTTRDPIGLAGGSLNLYTYVNNDPVGFTDPSGTFFPIVVPLYWATLYISAEYVAAASVIAAGGVIWSYAKPDVAAAGAAYERLEATTRALECGDTATDRRLFVEQGQATAHAGSRFAKAAQLVPGLTTNGLGPLTSPQDVSVIAATSVLTSQ